MSSLILLAQASLTSRGNGPGRIGPCPSDESKGLAVGPRWLSHCQVHCCIRDGCHHPCLEPVLKPGSPTAPAASPWRTTFLAALQPFAAVWLCWWYRHLSSVLCLSGVDCLDRSGWPGARSVQLDGPCELSPIMTFASLGRISQFQAKRIWSGVRTSERSRAGLPSSSESAAFHLWSLSIA